MRKQNTSFIFKILRVLGWGEGVAFFFYFILIFFEIHKEPQEE